MRKFLILTLAAMLVFAITGCTSPQNDQKLLENAFAKYEAAESFRSEGKMTIAIMGMRMDPFTFEALYQAPDKHYMKMDMDFFGEKMSFETLTEGTQVKVRSDMFDEMDSEFQALLEEALLEEQDNPMAYEEMFWQLNDLVNFELIDNAPGLSDDYRTYKFILDSDELMREIREQMNLEDEFLSPELEELDPEELALAMVMIEMMLSQLEVTMEAILVVNEKTEYVHSLQLDISVIIPLPELGMGMDSFNMDYGIEVVYTDFNTELNFPEFD